MDTVVIILAVIIVVAISTSDGANIDNKDGPSVVAIVGSNITLRWCLTELQAFSTVNFYKHEQRLENKFAGEQLYSRSLSGSVTLRRDADFSFKNRFSGSILVIDGNGTCTITISSVVFEDAGSFIVVNRNSEVIEAKTVVVLVIVSKGADESENKSVSYGVIVGIFIAVSITFIVTLYYLRRMCKQNNDRKTDEETNDNKDNAEVTSITHHPNQTHQVQKCAIPKL